MDLFEAIRGRRSVRAWRPGEISADLLEALKDAVRWAPSAGNVQARLFAFVRRPEVRQALGAASFQPDLFTTVPLVVVGCTDDRIEERYGELGRTLFAPQDVAAGVQNLLLAAHGHGLGAVWVGAFDAAKVRDVLGLDEALTPVVLVPVGWPAEEPDAPERLPHDRLFLDVV